MVDKDKYGTLVKGMDEQFNLANDQYPKKSLLRAHEATMEGKLFPIVEGKLIPTVEAPQWKASSSPQWKASCSP